MGFVDSIITHDNKLLIFDFLPYYTYKVKKINITLHFSKEKELIHDNSL